MVKTGHRIYLADHAVGPRKWLGYVAADNIYAGETNAEISRKPFTQCNGLRMDQLPDSVILSGRVLVHRLFQLYILIER
jgi:hypothetical protein